MTVNIDLVILQFQIRTRINTDKHRSDQKIKEKSAQSVFIRVHFIAESAGQLGSRHPLTEKLLSGFICRLRE